MEHVKEVVNLGLSVPAQARSIAVIRNDEEYTRAAEILVVIKEIRKKIESVFKPIKQKIDASKKEVLDQEKAADVPLKEAEAWIKPLMVAYAQEQERERRQKQERLQAQYQKEQEERQLAAALAAEMEGDHEGASDIIAEEVFVPPVVITKSTPAVEGIAYREVWKYQVTNLLELLGAVANGKVPLNALAPNEVFLSQQARSMKQLLNYPGVKVWSEKIIAAGRR